MQTITTKAMKKSLKKNKLSCFSDEKNLRYKAQYNFIRLYLEQTVDERLDALAKIHTYDNRVKKIKNIQKHIHTIKL